MGTINYKNWHLKMLFIGTNQLWAPKRKKIARAFFKGSFLYRNEHHHTKMSQIVGKILCM